MKVLERNIQLEKEFQKYFYHQIDWRHEVKYRDIPILQNPTDQVLLRDIIFETKPEIIVEVGTAWGGQALLIADLLETAMGFTDSQVITVDDKSNNYVPENWDFPKHPRINYLYGKSLSGLILDSVESFCAGRDRVMVLLDSDHTKSHVLSELEAYGKFVTPGQYLVVCDTNTSEVINDFGEGPKEAVDEFLQSNSDYEIKTNVFSFLSFHTWLQKVKNE